MVWSYKQELSRKFVHLLSILYIMFYFLVSHYFSHKTAIFGLIIFLLLLSYFEYVRLYKKTKIPFISSFWKYKRDTEKHKLGSEVYFLIGIIISLSFFDIRIAIASILMTTFGDFISFYIGNKGKISIPTKKWKKLEGMIAQFLVDILVGFFLIRNIAILSGSPLWLIIIPMAFVATVVESFVTIVDDNLMIPVLSGLVGQICLFLI